MVGRSCDGNKVCDKKNTVEEEVALGRRVFSNSLWRMGKSSFREERIQEVGQEENFLGQGDGACGLDVKGSCQ